MAVPMAQDLLIIPYYKPTRFDLISGLPKAQTWEPLLPESYLKLYFNFYVCKSAQNWLHSNDLNQQQLKQVSSMWIIP